jgi:hypothetical protein
VLAMIQPDPARAIVSPTPACGNPGSRPLQQY